MAENIEENGCSQMDSAEHEEYVKASTLVPISLILFMMFLDSEPTVR